MEKFVIQGKKPITGTITPQGNKNETLPILCASIMNQHEVHIQNVPCIADIKQLIKILRYLKVEVNTKNDFESLVVKTNKLEYSILPKEMVHSLRGSVTLLAPLLARCGKVFLPKPGGDKIGRRRIDTHLLALSSLGTQIQITPEGYNLQIKEIVGCNILLDEMSVTATENAVMLASVAKGTTVIENAASEPHVQGICHFLQKQGVNIQGIGSNHLTIHGVEGYENLGPTSHTIGTDYLEVGCFIAIAALTGGTLSISNVNVKEMRMIDLCFRRLGIEIEYEDYYIHVKPNQKLNIQSDAHEQIPKIDDAPWPGFPADMISIALVIATQATGNILIHQKLFESRLFFTDKLISMGAKIVLCDPHRAMIIGPTALQGATLSSPDIRAGMALLIAALCAEGKSVIHNIFQIDRGYKQIDQRLRKLGADIQRIKL